MDLEYKHAKRMHYGLTWGMLEFAAFAGCKKERERIP
jgi:hypothetical protein